MATKVLLLPLFVSLLVVAAVGRQQSLTEAQQCRFQRISASQPFQQLQHEGGMSELWNHLEEQFQCAGVAPIKNTIRPNSLSLPNYHPAPALVYIQQGRALMGITFPGCAETFSSHQFQGQGQGQGQEQEQQQGESPRDRHHKVHRVRQGDMFVLPAGVTHWGYNDGNEDFVAVSITDLNNPANQLDLQLRPFYLAGSPAGGQQQGQETFENIFRAFDADLLAEAFNVPPQLVRTMQEDKRRGFIVNVPQGMKVIRPDVEEAMEFQRQRGQGSNGLEETFCTTKIRMNVDNPTRADIYSKQAGRLTIANQHKLPILGLLDLSLERGNLYPNAMLMPHWSMNGHSVVYVTRGEAQVQVVSQNGQQTFNDRVRQGDMFVVPQFFVTSMKAGNNGFDWVTFKTTASPMKSPLAGYTSIFRAMPLQVITNAYQCSPSEAQQLKTNRAGQSLLLSPARSSPF